jgi:serine O-acetyltransferase
MINNKTDYLQYLEADRVALGRKKLNLKYRLKNLIYPDYIWNFQRVLRKTEYYRNTKENNFFKKLYFVFLKIKLLRMSVKLGFYIPENVFGPGLAIIHYGTIIVNANAKIGSNCRIHADTNIGESGGLEGAPKIGNNVYLAPGVKIYGNISIANNIAIAANACVSSSFHDENILIGGIPAKFIKNIDIKQIIKHI